jgi:hypothetical protein
MIGNVLNVLVGLWLAYSAIFANPAGNVNNLALAGSAVAVIVLALWARQTDRMLWQSGSEIVLGAILLVTAAAHWAFGMAPLVCFWIVLLGGIAVAILAMWSVLYRPGSAQLDRDHLPERRAGVRGGG